MMGHKFSSSSSNINTLPDDVLVVIFAFLSLETRLRVSSVCRRWNEAVADSRLWKRIDISLEPQKQRRSSKLIIDGSKRLKPWWTQDVCLTEEISVLHFLKRYAGPSLKVLHINFINRQILSHLCDKCTNLKEVSFLSCNNTSSPVRFSKTFTASNFFHVLCLPKSLEILRLTLKGLSVKNTDKIELCNNMLRYLGANCTKLKILNLDDFVITAVGMKSLAEGLDLEELILSNVREDPRTIDAILNSVVDDLQAMTVFKLSINKSYMGNVNNFVSNMATKWTKLRRLGLSGGTLCPNETFQAMTSKLCHLESLELEGSIITNAVISVIAEDLKSLNDLELTNGYYTAQGIKCLMGHTKLKSLRLCQKQLTPSPLWLHAVYDVIATLPSIENVKLTGNRLTELHEAEFYTLKPIERKINVDIRDSVPAIKRQSFKYTRGTSRSDTRYSVPSNMPMMALDALFS